MALTLNNIAQSYLDSVGQPYDYGLKERIKFSIKYWRATLLRREFERQPRDTKFLQFFYMPLVTIDSADNCDIVTNCDIKVARNIPKPISTKSEPFSFVGDIYGKVTYLHSSLSEIQTASCTRFNNFIPRYRYINGNIYVYSKTLAKNLRIEGYFEDPAAAANLCSNNTCVTDNEIFPIGAHMLETILRGLRSGEMDIKSVDPEVEMNK